MSRRRRGGPGLVTIYWRDIPAQVSVTTEVGAEKVLLDERFQVAIDRAAVVAGLTDTNDYVNEWRRETGPIEGDPLTAAKTVAHDIDTSYPRDRIEALVANGGLAPATPGDSPS